MAPVDCVAPRLSGKSTAVHTGVVVCHFYSQNKIDFKRINTEVADSEQFTRTGCDANVIQWKCARV